MSSREQRIDVDLGISRTQTAQELPHTRNVPYTSFTVIAATAGAVFQLGAGQSAPLFPFDVGDSWSVDDPRCDEPVTDGLFILNDPQPGSSIIIQLGQSSQRSRGHV